MRWNTHFKRFFSKFSTIKNEVHEVLNSNREGGREREKMLYKNENSTPEQCFTINIRHRTDIRCYCQSSSTFHQLFTRACYWLILAVLFSLFCCFSVPKSASDLGIRKRFCILTEKHFIAEYFMAIWIGKWYGWVRWVCVRVHCQLTARCSQYLWLACVACCRLRHKISIPARINYSPLCRVLTLHCLTWLFDIFKFISYENLSSHQRMC